MCPIQMKMMKKNLKKIFDEYLEENHTLQVGGRYLFYTEEEYEQISNIKEELKEELEEEGFMSCHLDVS